jgi:hypothetical protein
MASFASQLFHGYSIAPYLTISLSNTKYVIMIIGTIPTSIGLLENLQDLYLYSNSLTGKICICSTVLFLKAAGTLGVIPASLGDCQSLMGALLYENQLEGMQQFSRSDDSKTRLCRTYSVINGKLFVAGFAFSVQ